MRWRRSVLIGITLCGVMMIGACGGSGSSNSSTASTGKQLFVQNCGSCHTLAAAGTSGGVGPNLDTQFHGKQPAAIEATVRHKIANGGGAMQASIVTGSAAAKVAAYVASAAK